MIIVIHQNNTLVKILNENREEINHATEKDLVSLLFSIAKSYPNEIILWCNRGYVDSLDFDNIGQIFHHPKMMVSYSVANKKYLTDHIGYVDDTPFINVKYNVSYPTWLMSSDVGGIHAVVLNSLNPNDFLEKKISLFLNSLANTAMSGGLLCYSNPSLLKGNPKPKIPLEQVSNFELFIFIRRHYKKGWVFFLFTSLLFFEKKLSFFPLIASVFYKKKNLDNSVISKIEAKSMIETSLVRTIDVIIPTIGRKKYLYDVLIDLTAQTVLPKRVIIVEQNPDLDTTSELDYVYALDWPYEIVHKFTHRTGACNARNLAIAETRSEWVFFADDDNRLRPDTLEQALRILSELGARAITSSYLQKNEKKTGFTIRQWPTFGAGNSFIKGDVARSIKFDLSYEHGYGEDKDYGMKLRNIGVDVIYHPFDILHLKAPIGGFRNSIEKPWESESILPKPSPTIMLYRLKHTTKQQLRGYKILLFIKFYKKQAIKNPIAYIQKMNNAWNSSVNWAKTLDE